MQVENVAQALLKAKRIFTTGIGKSGYVARRTAASMTSVGVSAQFVHAAEWVHGDLGCLEPGSAVLAFSHSGNTKELCDLTSVLQDRGVMSAAIVGSSNGRLCELCDDVVVVPCGEELLGLVPSRSIVAQEAVTNAILSELVNRRNFQVCDFGKNHPGGNIGNLLS